MLGGLLLAAVVAQAATVPGQPGETYEIRRVHRMEYQTSNGSSGNSNDIDSIVERIISRSDEGLEVEYDLPAEVPAEQPADVWQFPARVFKPFSGSPRLLNAAELETRVDAWLRAADWPREVCGHWIFTWNAFRIDCDPQSVLGTIAAFDPGANGLEDGSPYKPEGALEAAPVHATRSGRDGTTYEVTLQLDPEVIRREEANSDLVVAEISHATLSPEEALRAHADEKISGTIKATFETDASGQAWRRTTVTEIHVERSGGEIETRTTTENLERRRARRAGPAPDTI